MTHSPENDAAWTPFDYDNRDANPLPESWVTVWVFDEFYDGVTIGYWADGWWQTFTRKDDVSVTHWMSMSPPDAPRVIPPGSGDAPTDPSEA